MNTRDALEVFGLPICGCGKALAAPRTRHRFCERCLWLRRRAIAAQWRRLGLFFEYLGRWIKT